MKICSISPLFLTVVVIGKGLKCATIFSTAHDLFQYSHYFMRLIFFDSLIFFSLLNPWLKIERDATLETDHNSNLNFGLIFQSVS